MYNKGYHERFIMSFCFDILANIYNKIHNFMKLQDLSNSISKIYQYKTYRDNV